VSHSRRQAVRQQQIPTMGPASSEDGTCKSGGPRHPTSLPRGMHPVGPAWQAPSVGHVTQCVPVVIEPVRSSISTAGCGTTMAAMQTAWTPMEAMTYLFYGRPPDQLSHNLLQALLLTPPPPPPTPRLQVCLSCCWCCICQSNSAAIDSSTALCPQYKISSYHINIVN